MIFKRVAAVVVPALALSLCAAGTAQAQAGSVRVERGRLIVQAASGQDNRVTVAERDGRLWVSDVVPLTPGAGCAGVTATQVACTARDVASVHIALGDRDDSAVGPVMLPLTVSGGDGNDTLTGGRDNDTLSGGNGADTISGGPGDDTLYGGDGATDPQVKDDYLNGGEGNDTLYGGTGHDDLHGGPGQDYLDGEGWSDSLWGGEDNDQLRGGTPNGGNLLNGGSGNDEIFGSGPDMRDSVDYSEKATGVVVNLWAGTGGEPALGEADTIKDVQNIVGGKGDDKLIGNGNDNLFTGGPGADQCDHDGADGEQLFDCP